MRPRVAASAAGHAQLREGMIDCTGILPAGLLLAQQIERELATLRTS